MFLKKLLFVIVLAVAMTSTSAQVVVTTTPADTAKVCVGAVINLSANATGGTGPYTYQWIPATNLSSASIPNPDFSSGIVGSYNYQVVATDNLGEDDTVNLVVVVNPMPVISVSANPTVMCPGGSVVLTGSGAVTYEWSGGLIGNPIVVSPAVTTTYTVTATSALGCLNTTTVVVVVPLPLSVNVTSDAPGDTLYSAFDTCLILNPNVSGGTPPYSYLWNNGMASAFPYICSPAAGYYALTVVDVMGCAASGGIMIYEYPFFNNGIIVNYFYDVNGNGLKDGTEQYTSAGMPGFAPSYNRMTHLSDQSWAFDVFQGTYDITTSSPSYIQTTNPQITISGTNTIENYDLGFQLAPGAVDFEVNISSYQPARPGFHSIYIFEYKNLSDNILSDVITFNADTLFDIDSVWTHSVFPDDSLISISGQQFNWQYTNLLPFESRTFYAKFYVPVNTALGTSYMNTISGLPVVNDVFLENNFDTIRGVVVGSYDPNDKAVQPYGPLTPAQVLAAPKLEYTIRFQNVGTYMATTVKIKDTLSANLDLSSFENVISSHPCTLSLADNYLEWTFNNINLPDSASNPAGSSGYVQYRIKPLTTLQVGDSIKNTAYIYFDFNAAVITNTVVTKIAIAPAAIDEVSMVENKIIAYPNPFSDQTTLLLPPETQYPCTLSMYDPLGREVLKMEKNTDSKITISRKGLPGGMYMIRILNSKQKDIGSIKVLIN